MGLIELYIIFALTTALTSWYLFYAPAMREARELQGTSTTLKYPVISSIVYILLGIIVAPLLFPPIIFQGAGERFKQGLLNSMLKEE